jgi:hypothetical protein
LDDHVRRRLPLACELWPCVDVSSHVADARRARRDLPTLLSVQAAQAVSAAALLVLASRAAPTRCGTCRWPVDHGWLGPHIRVGTQILLGRVDDPPVLQERLEAWDVAGELAHRVPVSGDKRAVPLGLLPMLVPGSPHLSRQARPPGDQLLVLSLGPEDRQRRRGVLVGAVPSEGAPAWVVHRQHAGDRRDVPDTLTP